MYTIYLQSIQLPQREPKQEKIQGTAAPQQQMGAPPAYSPYNQVPGGPPMPQPAPVGFAGYGKKLKFSLYFNPFPNDKF